jgi:hypothetical protein
MRLGAAGCVARPHAVALGWVGSARISQLSLKLWCGARIPFSDWNWGTLDRLDPVTGEPQRRYKIAPGTKGLAFGNAGRLWAASEAGSRHIYDHPLLGLFQPFFPLGRCQINAHRAEVASGGIRDHAAVTAFLHWFAASARKIRSVERETRWRWRLKVLWTAACMVRNRWAERADLNRCGGSGFLDSGIS